tara:strand:+ start:551 stop:1408 length:858 start_codon:yes stop_codon:yes gene_type:complete
MNIVGLGKAGCAIAGCFSKFSQYNVYKFDANIEGENCFNLPICKSHDEYEKSCPDFRESLQKLSGEVVFVVSGAGKVSGCALRLLEQFTDALITILYVEPDCSLLSEIERTQETIVKNVLQEYARSGVFERIYLISNSAMEKSIGDIPIMGYYDTINQAIVNTLHMVNVFKNSEPVLGTFTEPHEIARISTLGVVDIEKDEEKWFFDLQIPRDVVYYYGIGESDLKSDGSLFKKITNYTKGKLEENINVSYGVYQTAYEQKYCYCVKHSSVVQSYIDKLDDQDIG